MAMQSGDPADVVASESRNLAAVLALGPCLKSATWQKKPCKSCGNDKANLKKVLKDYGFHCKDYQSIRSKADFQNRLKDVKTDFEPYAQKGGMLLVYISGYGDKKDAMLFTGSQEVIQVRKDIEECFGSRRVAPEIVAQAKLFVVQGCYRPYDTPGEDADGPGDQAAAVPVPTVSNLNVYWSHIPGPLTSTRSSPEGTPMITEMCAILNDSRGPISLNDLITECNRRLNVDHPEEIPTYNGTPLVNTFIQHVS